MFTGLIEEVGILENLSSDSKSTVLTIRANRVLDHTTQIGDSIAVNGVCLTVTSIHSLQFTADVMNETLSRTNLGALKKGDRVNLERAMAVENRFGGHIVSGHIDDCGTVVSISEDDNAIWYEIQADESILKYIVEKGSIAIDGISLTVAAISENSFSVSTIPHTRKQTTLADRKLQDTVNLECDVIAKYVERLMGFSGKENKTNKSNVSMSFLAENGFL